MNVTNVEIGQNRRRINVYCIGLRDTISSRLKKVVLLICIKKSEQMHKYNLRGDCCNNRSRAGGAKSKNASISSVFSFGILRLVFSRFSQVHNILKLPSSSSIVLCQTSLLFQALTWPSMEDMEPWDLRAQARVANSLGQIIRLKMTKKVSFGPSILIFQIFEN